MGVGNQKKITVVLPFLSGEGGTETVVNEWIVHFSSSPLFKMTYLLPQGSMKDNWYKPFKGLRVFKLAQSFKKARVIRNLLGAVWLAYHILTTSPDEVVCLSTKLIYEVSILKKVFHKNFKIVSWIHFSLLHGKDINLNDLKKADYHLALSSGIQRQMNDIGILNSRIRRVGNPIPKAEYIVPPSTDGVTKFIYIGRIFVDGQKNLRELIKGLSALNEYTTKWTLDVIGDGPDMDEFKALINENGIESKVTIHGWVKQPFKQFSTADCLVLTSKYEGFVMVLLEAIARGIPVISSNCPTGPEDIVSDFNGYLYPPGDVQALTEKLVAMAKREKVFDHHKLPATVSEFYTDSYFEGLEKALNDFLADVR